MASSHDQKKEQSLENETPEQTKKSSLLQRSFNSMTFEERQKLIKEYRIDKRGYKPRQGDE